MKISRKAGEAIKIGTLCTVFFLAVHFTRNTLSAVTPQILEEGLAEKYIGKVASLYLAFYAIGQLINGAIGDRIKGRYMISLGLLSAGVMNLIFANFIATQSVAMLAYALTGFSMSMIYGPMTKLVSENTEPLYATRCSLSYTTASFFGSPIAGAFASVLAWKNVLIASSTALITMAVVSFLCILRFEKRGFVRYGQYRKVREKKGDGIKILLRHHFVKFSFIAVVTGIIGTSVVFWLPTYFSQKLGFSPQEAATIFTVVTLANTATVLLSGFIYELVHRDMNIILLVSFSVSALSFLLLYFVEIPVVNVILIALAIMGSNSAATMLWSKYCPSLRDTGAVSSAAGFLNFLNFMSAAVANYLFAKAFSSIGWGNLILVWFALMAFGTLVCLPYRSFFRKPA